MSNIVETIISRKEGSKQNMGFLRKKFAWWYGEKNALLSISQRMYCFYGTQWSGAHVITIIKLYKLCWNGRATRVINIASETHNCVMASPGGHTFVSRHLVHPGQSHTASRVMRFTPVCGRPTLCRWLLSASTSWPPARVAWSSVRGSILACG
jgi:hypothetical protein